MRAALCLLLVIAPVCARPPTDGDARAFLAFMTKLAELREAEIGAVGNEVALARAQKATKGFLDGMKGREVVWPVVVQKVKAANRLGNCPVECNDLVPTCRKLQDAAGVPAAWAKIGKDLRGTKYGDTRLSLAVALPESDAGGLKQGGTYFVRVRLQAAAVNQTGQGGLSGVLHAGKAALVK